jgi:hypothetical protein
MLTMSKLSARRIRVSLCPTGRTLNRAWTDALACGDAVEIRKAMQAYYYHRNGSPSGTGPNQHPCLLCSLWTSEN